MKTHLFQSHWWRKLNGFPLANSDDYRVSELFPKLLTMGSNCLNENQGRL